MALTTTKPSLMTRVVLALLAVSSVCALPIQGSRRGTPTRSVAGIQPREPRIIPDTGNYLASILNEIGLGPPSQSEPAPEVPSPVPVPFYIPTPAIEISDQGNGNIEDIYPSVYPPSATPSNHVTTWTNIHNDSDRPVKVLQIGDWHGGNKIETSDIPEVLDAVQKLVEHRLNDIYSSDETR